jgi:hypothetical protein
MRSSILTACVLLCAASAAVDVSAASFTPRLTEQRLPLIGKEGRTPDQERMLSSRADFNIYKTLAHHPHAVLSAGANWDAICSTVRRCRRAIAKSSFCVWDGCAKRRTNGRSMRASPKPMRA